MRARRRPSRCMNGTSPLIMPIMVFVRWIYGSARPLSGLAKPSWNCGPDAPQPERRTTAKAAITFCPMYFSPIWIKIRASKSTDKARELDNFAPAPLLEHRRIEPQEIPSPPHVLGQRRRHVDLAAAGMRDDETARMQMELRLDLQRR